MRRTVYRNQRGVVFPSPVVMLSIIAVAMAGVAYVATQGEEPTEREVTAVSRPATEPSDEPSQAMPTAKPEKLKPVVQREKVFVEVYNNSSITGLAGRVAGRAQTIGWNVVGADNWDGVIPESTVYYPKRLKAAGKQLALDLGIRRTMPAVPDAMRGDRLTVVLTGDPS